MSQIKLSGNPSGTGTLTIASPNTNSDYTLNLPASSGTVLADGASQSPTFNGVTATTLTVNSNNISAVNSLGFRNRIINGDMRIDQRNAGASVTPTNYFIDRWAYFGTTTPLTAQQVTAVPTGFSNSMLLTATSSVSPGSTDYRFIQQAIEGFNVADLGWGTANAQTVTISFWVRSSLTGTFGGAVCNSAENRSYPFSFAVIAANTWEYKTVAISGDTTGTWLTTNGIGLRLKFDLGSGSNRKGTVGAWAATNYDGATGAVNLVGTNGATFYITGVQLEAGSVATPFERRPYGTELMLCQRYYEKSYDPGSVPGTASVSAGLLVFGTPFASINNSFGNMTGFRFQVQKRATPTVTAYSYQGNAGRLTTGSSLGTELAAGSATPSGIGVNGASTDNVSGAGITIGGNALFFHYTASAEL